MNRSEILRALEWVDQAAQDGDGILLAKAKQALDEALVARRESTEPEAAYKIAFESFIRKHGREPLEDISDVEKGA